MLGPDPDHELAFRGGETRAALRELGGKREPLRSEREDKPIRGPRDRRLVQVHRRRADERGDEEVRGLLVQVLRGGELLERAVAHDRDPVSHRHRLGLVVGDVERRHAEPPLDAQHLAAHLDAQVGVEVRERLVHEEHGRLADERPPHGDALALTARQLGGLPEHHFREPEDLGRRARLPLALLLRYASHPERECDVLDHVHVRIEGVVLEDHRNVALLGREVVDDLVVEADRSRRHVLEAGHHPERRRLAAARRADENRELPVIDEEVELPNGLYAVREHLRQLLEGQGRHSGSSLLVRHGDPDPHPAPVAVCPCEVGNGQQLRAGAADIAGSSRRSRYSVCRQSSSVAEDARERHAGHAAQLRDRAAVDGVGRTVESDLRQIRAGRKVRLLDAVDDRAAFERDAPPNGIDARIRRR